MKNFILQKIQSNFRNIRVHAANVNYFIPNIHFIFQKIQFNYKDVRVPENANHIIHTIPFIYPKIQIYCEDLHTPKSTIQYLKHMHTHNKRELFHI